MPHEEIDIPAMESSDTAENLGETAPPAKSLRPHYKPKNAVGTSFLISLAIHVTLLLVVGALVMHYSTGKYANSGFFSKLNPQRAKTIPSDADADEDDALTALSPPAPLLVYSPFETTPATESESAAERGLYSVPPEFLTPPNIELDGVMDEPYLWGVNPSAGFAPCPIHHLNPATDSSK